MQAPTSFDAWGGYAESELKDYANDEDNEDDGYCRKKGSSGL